MAGSNNDLSHTESKRLDILFPECVTNITMTDGENVLFMTSLPAWIYRSIIKYQNMAKKHPSDSLSHTHTQALFHSTEKEYVILKSD